MPKKLREYVLSVDNYNKPKVYEGVDAVPVLLIRLFKLNPGEIETHPEMGIGLYKNWRNMWMDDIYSLQIEAEKQIAKYLPNLSNVEVKITQSKKNPAILEIEIQVENTIYSLISNSDTKELSLNNL